MQGLAPTHPFINASVTQHTQNRHATTHQLTPHHTHLQVCGSLLLDPALVPRIRARLHHQLLAHQRAATMPAAPTAPIPAPAPAPEGVLRARTRRVLWRREVRGGYGSSPPAACCWRCCCCVAAPRADLLVAHDQEAPPLHDFLTLDEQHTPADCMHGACV
jgi:hypothetical protein